MIHTHAFARAGLIGNPSDGFFGKTISIILRNFSAEVTCQESSHLVIVPHQYDRLEYESVDELMEDIQIRGYYGGIRLIKAAIKCFGDYCRKQGTDLSGRNFTIGYRTDIPVRLGMGGSSAIVTAVFRALMEFYDVQIHETILPNLILSAEKEELNIECGLQDRVIQVYEGIVFMDFERSHLEQNKHGRYERLDTSSLPPLFVVYHHGLAEGTEVIHNDLHLRYNRGDQDVHDAMVKLGNLAQEARDLLVSNRGSEIGPLMDANFDLRAEICTIGEGNRELVNIGRRLGACVKFAGSGGAMIGTYDGDPERLDRLNREYAEIGAKVILPVI